MTSRDSYRRPVSSEAALAELRRVAGTQLDPQVVEVFERMIRDMAWPSATSDEADFEAELAFDRRVDRLRAAPHRRRGLDDRHIRLRANRPLTRTSA